MVKGMDMPVLSCQMSSAIMFSALNSKVAAENLPTSLLWNASTVSHQIIQWANKSKSKNNGQTLILIIHLVFKKATDEATWSEMYMKLYQKMQEKISSNIQDNNLKNMGGKFITGGALFWKYLLNWCQEDFEHGWSAKESATAAKASEDQAVKEAFEPKGQKDEGEVALYSEEYYAVEKAKQQGLGLVKFISELFKLQMLMEHIMHECIQKLPLYTRS